MVKKTYFSNKAISFGWIVFAGVLFWVNAYSLFSNHKETTFIHSSGINLHSEYPAKDTEGDNLISEKEFNDPSYPHRRLPLLNWGLYASSEEDGFKDIDNVTTERGRLEKDFLDQGYEDDLAMLSGEAQFGNCLNGIFTMNYDGFSCCCAYATEICQGLARTSFGFPSLPVDAFGKKGALPGYVRAVVDSRWFRSNLPGTQNKNRFQNKDIDFTSPEVQSTIQVIPAHKQWRYVMNKGFDPKTDKPEGLKNLISYCKGEKGLPPEKDYAADHPRRIYSPNPNDPLGKSFAAFIPKDTPNGSQDWAPNPRVPFESCIRPYDSKDESGRRVFSSDLHKAYELADDYCFNNIPAVPHMSQNGLFKDKQGRHSRWNQWAERYETFGVDSKDKQPFDHRFKIKHSDTYFHYRANLPDINKYGYEFNCILEVARPFELEVRHVDPCPAMVKYSNRGRNPNPRNCLQSEGYEYQDTHNAYGPLYLKKDSTKPNSFRMATQKEYPPEKHPGYFGDNGAPNMNCVDTKRKCLKHDKWTKKCTSDGANSGDSSVIFPDEQEAKANSWENTNIPKHDHKTCKPLEWDFFSKQYAH